MPIAQISGGGGWPRDGAILFVELVANHKIAGYAKPITPEALAMPPTATPARQEEAGVERRGRACYREWLE